MVALVVVIGLFFGVFGCVKQIASPVMENHNKLISTKRQPFQFYDGMKITLEHVEVNPSKTKVIVRYQNDSGQPLQSDSFLKVWFRHYPLNPRFHPLDNARRITESNHDYKDTNYDPSFRDPTNKGTGG
ncbi:hypothetical protein [Marininema mesophilum]|uniref:hypothetical protein n=1 Tax=Marininema mesophilum TaxID=1048340 RepID=UPI00115F94C1|nr:hypothetical protein [Marininema mesophilum]